MIYKVVLLVLFLSFGSTTSYSQNWDFAKKISGVGNISANGIQVDAAGNSFITGTLNGATTFDTITLSAGNTHSIYAAKYNAAGNIIWAKIIASAVDTLYGIVSAEAIAINGSGEIFITGNYFGSATFFGVTHTSVGASEIYLMKLTSDGEPLWFRTAGGNGVGNYNQNAAYALCLDREGNSYISGRYFTTATFDTITISSALPNEFYLAKYNAQGNICWVRSGGGDFGTHTGLAVACDSSGDVYATGQFFGHLTIGSTLIDAGDAEQKMFLIKYSSLGELQWTKEIGSGGYYGGAESITIDKNNNTYITGFFRATMIIGSTQLSYNHIPLAYAMFIVKYSSDGSIVFAEQTGGDNQNAKGNSISSDIYGHLFIAGNMRDQTIFGNTTLRKDSGAAGFITELDSNGKFLRVAMIGGEGSSIGNAVALNSFGEIILTGNFSDTINFDDHVLIGSVNTNAFIAKYHSFNDGVNDPQNNNAQLTAFPNPANRIVHLKNLGACKLIDILGRTVFESKDCSEISTENLPSGIYYLNGKTIVIRH